MHLGGEGADGTGEGVGCAVGAVVAHWTLVVASEGRVVCVVHLTTREERER